MCIVFSRKSYKYVKKGRALKKIKLSESSLTSSVSVFIESSDESCKRKTSNEDKEIVEVITKGM